MTTIRRVTSKDYKAIWEILRPIFEAGDTYALPTDINRQEALSFWCGGSHTAYVVEEANTVLGTYYIGPNQQGGGAHVCNCGFAVPGSAQGKGVARSMLSHALETAKEAGFHAMQFNFVVASNERALKIWFDNGFEEVGRLPGAFLHPTKGYVDACVLYKKL